MKNGLIYVKRKLMVVMQHVEEKKSSLKNYPYCRPLHKINKGTPMTVGEMIKKYGKKIEQMCKKKNSKKNVKSNTYM